MPPLPRDPAAAQPPTALALSGAAARAARPRPTTGDPHGKAASDLHGRAAGELMRLFVAIAPPPEVLDELDAVAAPWRSARQDLRWTSLEAWHVTLAFLGEVEESKLPKLLPRLERAAQRHPAVALAFSGAGAFPAAQRANVLWSGLSGDGNALAGLAASVAAGASRAGATPPDRGRRFQPHLTLARCRLPADVTSIVAALSGFQGQAWTVDRIHLVRSRLGGHIGAVNQPRFTTLAWWPLR
jgi:2'-5' RNA ligase